MYFKNHGFHDFSLKAIEVVHSAYSIKKPVLIKIIITDEGNTWEIKYKGIKKFIISYEKENYLSDRYGFDGFGYDEFLPVDDKLLSHEILFVSGATVLIYFEKISINKLSNNREMGIFLSKEHLFEKQMFFC
jgi:hypothetical protein